MSETLKEWAAHNGYQVAWGSRAVVGNARREIGDRRSGCEIDEHLFEHELKPIVAGESDPAMETVVLVAVPRPAHRIHFELEGRSLDALLPPTYFRYRALFEEVRQDLVEHGLPGARLEQMAAPLKAIASRLGLVRYGRNNVGYVPGVGSYFQLCGYWTDATLPEMETAAKGAVLLLSQCENCSICASVCPTGAITEEHVLLRAERCLTFANENPGEWPDWVSPQAHNSLLGCLECQRACPANPKLPVEPTGLSFSAAETQWLLSDQSANEDRAETGVGSKLAWLGQPYMESVLGRNLRALAKESLP